MIKQSSDDKIFEHLVNNYYKEYSINQLSKETKFSIPKLWKTISILRKNNLIIHGRIKVNLDHALTKVIKDYIDVKALIIFGKNMLEFLKHFKDSHEEIKAIILYFEKHKICFFIIVEPNLNICHYPSFPLKGKAIVKDLESVKVDILNNKDYIIKILKNNIVYHDPYNTFYDLMKIFQNGS